MEDRAILKKILSGELEKKESNAPITFEEIFYANYSTFPENGNVFERSPELENAINNCVFLSSKDERAFKMSQNLVKSIEIIAKEARASIFVSIDEPLNTLSVSLITSNMFLKDLVLASLSVAIASCTDLLWCEDFISFSLEFEKLYTTLEI